MPEKGSVLICHCEEPANAGDEAAVLVSKDKVGVGDSI